MYTQNQTTLKIDNMFSGSVSNFHLFSGSVPSPNLASSVGARFPLYLHFASFGLSLNFPNSKIALEHMVKLSLNREMESGRDKVVFLQLNSQGLPGYVHFRVYRKSFELMLKLVLTGDQVDLRNETVSDAPDLAHDLNDIRDDASAMTSALYEKEALEHVLPVICNPKVKGKGVKCKKDGKVLRVEKRWQAATVIQQGRPEKK